MRVHETYRITYILKVVKLCCRDEEGAATKKQQDAFLPLILSLTETENDLCADIMDYARAEIASGYRNLARWWVEDTVRGLLNLETGHIGAHEIRAYAKGRYGNALKS